MHLLRFRPSLLAIGVVFSLSTAARSQQVTVDLTALTELAAGVYAPTQVTTETEPAGPMQPFGHVEAVGPGASGTAIINWLQTPSPYRIETVITSQVLTPAGSPAVATTGPFEVLLTVQATAPTLVEITLSGGYFDMLAGSIAPQLAVDVDNDGFVDFADLPASGTVGPFQAMVGGQPKLLRVIMQSTASTVTAASQSTAQLRVTVEPQNYLHTMRTALSCYPSTYPISDLDVRPTFADRGFDVLTVPSLLVFGFSAQPVLLDPQSPIPFLSTCLLMPSPDVLFWAPLGQVHLAAPQAVRPLELHVQGVMPTSQGWATTDAYRIDAF